MKTQCICLLEGLLISRRVKSFLPLFKASRTPPELSRKRNEDNKISGSQTCCHITGFYFICRFLRRLTLNFTVLFEIECCWSFFSISLCFS